MRLLEIIISIFSLIYRGLTQYTMHFNASDLGAGSNPIFTYPLETETGFIVQR